MPKRKRRPAGCTWTQLELPALTYDLPAIRDDLPRIASDLPALDGQPAPRSSSSKTSIAGQR